MARPILTRSGQKTLTRVETERLLVYVEESTGLHLAGNRLQSLVAAVQDRANSSGILPSDFLQNLLVRNAALERDWIVELTTNQETSFFRGPSQLEVLDGEVLRPLLAGRPSSTVRLWSAACSTGEEVYTIGMMVQDQVGRSAIPGVSHPRVEIVGSDICQKTVQRAAAGNYSARAEGQVGPVRTDRYFESEDGRLVINQAELPRTNFYVHNLTRPSPFGVFDVVLVRNVLFYLSDRSRKVAMRNLCRALKPSGVIVIGANDGEVLSGEFESLGTHCYRRKTGGAS